jgi:hypothetical protein
MTTTDSTTVAPQHPHPPTHLVSITVNGKPVNVAGPRTTGLTIKQAAMSQGVAIQLDFVLSVEVGPKKTKLVRDDEALTVHPGSKFVAIPNDDNS